MDDDPLVAMFGLGIAGFGLLLGYATWKKVPGGAVGMLKSVLTTGKLVKGNTGTNLGDFGPGGTVGGGDFGTGDFNVGAAGGGTFGQPVAPVIDRPGA